MISPMKQAERRKRSARFRRKHIVEAGGFTLISGCGLLKRYAMWKWLKRRLDGLVGIERVKKPRVRLGAPRNVGRHPRMHVSFGDPPTGPPGDAWLCAVDSPESLRRTMQWVGRRQLPVEGWVIWGFDLLPRRVEIRARWLAQLARTARPASVWLVPAAEPPGRTAPGRRRLMANLRRFGCRVDEVETSCHSDAQPAGNHGYRDSEESRQR